MIDLRYHIVSIMAVFLALGTGILLGSALVSSPLEAQLHDDLTKARNDRRKAQTETSALKDENDLLTDRLGSEVAPWAVQNRLDGASVVLVIDGPEPLDWREHVLDSLVAAGATTQGTISLTAAWALEKTEERTELITAIQTVVPGFEPGEDLAESALELLGESFVTAQGRALIDELASAGFLLLQGPRDEQWPGIDTTVVVLSGSRTGESEPIPGGSSFARSVAERAPTLVATDDPEGSSLVGMLRSDGDTPERLATFDSATNADDPGGIGVTAAVLAAIEGRGAHFGAARGLSFVAPLGATVESGGPTAGPGDE